MLVTGSDTLDGRDKVSDGAAAVLLTRRSKAKELGLPILAKFCCCAVAGVEPKVMGIGPAFAIPKVLSKVGISKDEVDLWEINEGELFDVSSSLPPFPLLSFPRSLRPDSRVIENVHRVLTCVSYCRQLSPRKLL